MMLHSFVRGQGGQAGSHMWHRQLGHQGGGPGNVGRERQEPGRDTRPDRGQGDGIAVNRQLGCGSPHHYLQEDRGDRQVPPRHWEV